jgi:hypothetical protein
MDINISADELEMDPNELFELQDKMGQGFQ